MIGISDLGQKAAEALRVVADLAQEATRPLKAAASAARHAFQPTSPGPAPRKSKGWRRHLRRMKAGQRHS